MSYECYCDYDPPDWIREELRKARKSHNCEECGDGAIQPGEMYEHVVGQWDGYISTFKHCERCRDIRIWTKNNVPCLCWAYGNVIEDCREAINEAWSRAPDETGGLRFGFLRRIAQRDKLNLRRRKELAA